MTVPIVSAVQVGKGMEATLQAWFPYALWRVSTDAGVGVPPQPASWVRPVNVANVTVDQFPIVAVTTTGAGGFERLEAGVWDATWDFDVSWWVRSDRVESVADTVKLYAAAVLNIGAHQAEWGGVASASWPTSAAFSVNTASETRTLGEGRQSFGVRVSNVAAASDWPAVPPSPPYPPTLYTAHTIKVSEALLAHPAN